MVFSGIVLNICHASVHSRSFVTKITNLDQHQWTIHCVIHAANRSRVAIDFIHVLLDAILSCVQCVTLVDGAHLGQLPFQSSIRSSENSVNDLPCGIVKNKTRRARGHCGPVFRVALRVRSRVSDAVVQLDFPCLGSASRRR